MQIRNGVLFCPDGSFQRLDLEIRGDKTGAIGSVKDNGQAVLDACGCYVAPGFVDIHIHGAVGADFSDGETDAIRAMPAFHHWEPTGLTAANSAGKRMVSRRCFFFAPAQPNFWGDLIQSWGQGTALAAAKQQASGELPPPRIFRRIKPAVTPTLVLENSKESCYDKNRKK